MYTHVLAFSRIGGLSHFSLFDSVGAIRENIGYGTLDIPRLDFFNWDGGNTDMEISGSGQRNYGMGMGILRISRISEGRDLGYKAYAYSVRHLRL